MRRSFLGLNDVREVMFGVYFGPFTNSFANEARHDTDFMHACNRFLAKHRAVIGTLKSQECRLRRLRLYANAMRNSERWKKARMTRKLSRKCGGAGAEVVAFMFNLL